MNNQNNTNNLDQNVNQNSQPVNNGVNVNVPIPNINIQDSSIPGSVNTVSTNQQTPMVSQVVTNPSNTNNGGNLIPPPEKKSGKAKTILLIIFFIFLFLFIMFLPEISSFIKNGKATTNNNEVVNGTLTCTMEKSSDTTKNSYQVDFKFTNKELMTSSSNFTVECEDNSIVKFNAVQCKNINNAASSISGIDVTCTSADNISTMIQSYNYKLINRNKLTAFTEAGGTYPEFKYKDNIYDIQSDMIKAKYDCEIKAS